MQSGLSETISTGRPVHVQVAASTSLRLTAHTSQWSWVTITSGASAPQRLAVDAIDRQAVAHDLAHAASISALEPSTLNFGAVSAGRRSTSAG